MRRGTAARDISKRIAIPERAIIMSSEGITRRGFVEAVGISAGAASVLGAPAIGKGASANDKIRLGLIGAGSRGNQLLDSFLPQTDVEIVAVADVDDRHAGETAERVKKEKGNTPETARDYRAMLDRKDIDAVIIATPDHWHALPAIHAVLAGKDVYVEKPVGHNVAEGQAMIRAARKTNKIMAVGTQQRSSIALPEGRRDRPLGQARQGLLGPDLELREHQPDRHGQVPRQRGPLAASTTTAGSAPRPSGRSTRTASTCSSAGSSTTPAA